MLSSRLFNLSGGLRMFHVFSVALAVAAMLCYSTIASASIIVRDTWQDGTDTDPAAPTYSENGTDVEPDGDIESVWYLGGAGTLDPVAAGGPQRGELSGTSSSSWTTYFTPEGSEVDLANIGDALCIKWVFTTGVISTTTNTSQNMRIAVVNSPSLTRIVADGTPGGGTYTGYGIFANMGPSLGRNDPFEIVERINTSALLSASGDWGAPAGQVENANTGDSGYQSDTEYTFEMMITHNANNNLDITASMTGGTLNNSNGLLTTLSDVAPNGGSFKFDTFALRPSNQATTSSLFDTSLFQVEFKEIPEPASFALLGLGSLALLMWRRRS